MSPIETKYLVETLPYKGGRIFAVGDLHGCAHELVSLLDYLEGLPLLPQDQVVFIGDYIDRGPDSRLVISFLLDFAHRYPDTVFLKGNHEEMFLRALTGEPLYVQQFAVNGGEQTARSYGVRRLFAPDAIASAMPESHIHFINSLKHGVQIGEFLFVHAGVDPTVSLDEQGPQSLLWIREPFIEVPHSFGLTVVFGHTPFRDVFLNLPYKVGIDTGAVFGNKLTCLEVIEMRLAQVATGGDGEVLERVLPQQERESVQLG